VSDGSFVASYLYDYRGLRVGKTTPSGTTTYLWDPQGNLYRESGPGGVREYFWDGNGGLARVDCTPQGGQKTILYSHLNARGDVLSLWDDTLAHNIFATYRYGPWGEILSAEGSMAGQPIRYASYYYGSETGLYYLKGRYYSPHLGRFLTTDPAQPLSSYCYAFDNPITFIDPSGAVPRDSAEEQDEVLALGGPEYLFLLTADGQVIQVTLEQLSRGFAGAGKFLIVAAVIVTAGGAVLVVGAAICAGICLTIDHRRYELGEMSGDEWLWSRYYTGVSIASAPLALVPGWELWAGAWSIQIELIDNGVRGWYDKQ